jgi:hypothetical protein
LSGEVQGATALAGWLAIAVQAIPNPQPLGSSNRVLGFALAARTKASVPPRDVLLPGGFGAFCVAFEFLAHPFLQGDHVLRAAQEILD